MTNGSLDSVWLLAATYVVDFAGGTGSTLFAFVLILWGQALL